MLTNMTFEEFKEKAKAKFGDKYRYIRIFTKDKPRGKTGKVNKINYIEYECPEHGIIQQDVYTHLRSKYGCRFCQYASMREFKTVEEVINACRKVHGDKYNYLHININRISKEDMIIECPIEDEFGKHGIFKQSLSNHLKMKTGCPICGGTHGMTLERFINKANKVHNFKYTYDNAVYKDAHTKLLITCSEHGDFLQTPNDHLSGCGCPECKMSHMERETKQLLSEYKINFEEQKQFDWLIFKKRGRMKLDFYLPDYNIAIECQGEQHFYPIEYYHGKEKFEVIKERDKYKKKLCEENNVKLEYINYFDNLKDKLNEILEYVGAK